MAISDNEETEGDYTISTTQWTNTIIPANTVRDLDKYQILLKVFTSTCHKKQIQRGKKGQLHECRNNMLDPQIVCNPILQQQHILSETFLQIFPLKFQQVK